MKNQFEDLLNPIQEIQNQFYESIRKQSRLKIVLEIIEEHYSKNLPSHMVKQIQDTLKEVA